MHATLGHLIAVGHVLLSRPAVVVEVELGTPAHQQPAGLPLEQEEVGEGGRAPAAAARS